MDPRCPQIGRRGHREKEEGGGGSCNSGTLNSEQIKPALNFPMFFVKENGNGVARLVKNFLTPPHCCRSTFYDCTWRFSTGTRTSTSAPVSRKPFQRQRYFRFDTKFTERRGRGEERWIDRVIAADRFPIDQSERPFNGSRPDFPFRLSILEFSRVFLFCKSFCLPREKRKRKKAFSLRLGVNKSFKKKKSYCNVHLVNVENEAFDLNRQRIDHWKWNSV